MKHKPLLRSALCVSLLANGLLALGYIYDGEANADQAPRGTFELLVATPRAEGNISKLGPYATEEACVRAKLLVEDPWIETISGESEPATQWSDLTEKSRITTEVKVTIMGWRPTAKCIEVGV